MKSDGFMRIIQGPVGSGKSVGCVMEVVRRCQQMTPGSDGVRRSRWAIVRNTANQLKDTTLKTWFEWIPPGVAGTWKESEKTFFLEFGDVKAEILFRPLDSPDDVRRVLSLELTGVWCNEWREIPREITEALQGRLRRYPSRASVKDYWSGFIGDTNPPEVDSYHFKVMEHVPLDVEDPNTLVVCDTFKQPSGLSPEAENRDNLHPDYYTDLAKGKTDDWVGQYIRGEYAPSLSGVPVFGKLFKHVKHVSPTALEVYAKSPVILGLDFGRTPAAVFGQITQDGHINIIREAVEFDMGMDRFIKYHLRPKLRTLFPDNPLIFIGDPAGVKRNDTDEGSCMKMLRDEFKSEGATVKGAPTNYITPRLQAVESLLGYHPDGTPILRIDPSCTWLIDGLRSKYRYALMKNKDSDHQDTPEKNKWSHVSDALQYFALFAMSGKYDPGYYRREDKVDINPFNMIFPKGNPHSTRHAGY